MNVQCIFVITIYIKGLVDMHFQMHASNIAWLAMSKSRKTLHNND